MRSHNKTIHIVGDSISIQYGPYLEKFIAKSFIYSRKEGKLGNLDLPEGQNAGDSSMVLEYLKKCLTIKSHWDFIIMNCGLHDIKIYDESPQISIKQYERNLEQIFDLTNILSDKTIWVKTTPVIDDLHNSLKSEFKRFNKDVVKYNKTAECQAKSNNAVVIDLYEFCKCLGDREIYQDHVHFTPTIQKLQAAYITGHLSGLL